MTLLEHIGKGLADIDAGGLRRRLRVVDSAWGRRVRVDGRDLLAFCSNDYLGLANHPHIVAALQEGAALYGAGSGASHLISGHSRAHAVLEERLADLYASWIDCARALYFSTGYMANLSLLTALAQLDDNVEFFSEQLNHASLIDGMRMARASVKVYPHGDLGQLESLLSESSAAVKVIVTDSVFSMDGNLAPLAELDSIAERFDATLIVDDAHGFGVLGATGLGALEHLALRSPRVIYMGTLGKAAGVSGAFVVAHDQVVEWLVQRARPYIYTTASSPALAHALSVSLELIVGDEGSQRRAILHANRGFLLRAIRLQKWGLPESSTAIQPVIIGDNQHAVKVAGFLMNQGLWVPAIRPPTVPAGTARLRITLSASHTEEDVLRLGRAISRAELELDEDAYL